jgi:hypothetical protein
MMRPMRVAASRRSLAFLATGAVVWLAAALAAVWALGGAGGRARPLGRALRFSTADRRTVEAGMPRGWLAPGDRVLRLDGARLRECGEVLSLERPVGGATVRLALYPDAGLPDPLPPGTRLTLLDARGTLEWALGRVLSPERRARLETELDGVVAEREEWFRRTLGPVLEEFARGVVTDVTAELTVFARTRQDRLRDVGTDLLARAEARWTPLLRDLLWPRVLDKLTPLASKIGDELWAGVPWTEVAKAAASTAGGSLANYFLPGDWELSTGQLADWRDRYVRDTAIPTVEKHLPEALALVGQAVEEVADDPRVAEALRATVFEDGLGNGKVIALLLEAFSATVIDNPRIRRRLARLLDDHRVQRAVFDLAESLEPRLIALARSFLLDDEGRRLHPEIAMLVRVRLIESEGNWVLLEVPPAGAAVPGQPRGAAGRPRLEIRPFEGSTVPPWEKPR